MLTDYHLHLRPDDLDATAARVLHRRQRRALPRGGERARDRRARGLRARLPLPQALERLAPPVLARIRARRPRRILRRSCARRPTCGWASRPTSSPAPRIARRTCSSARDFDYVVGSVHFLGDHAVDMERLRRLGAARAAAEEIWRRYFETLGEAARSGLFDILAHPDLVKVWGREPPGPPRAICVATTSPRSRHRRIGHRGGGLHRRAAQAARRDLPGARVPEMCVEAGAPVALSSDAHLPEDVGSDYDQALELLDGAGVSELCVFERRAAAPGAASGPVWRDALAASATTATASRRAARCPRRRRDPERARARRALRRRRAHPRRHRRAARRGRAGRHRRALPRQRRALPRRRLDRAAAQRARRVVAAGLARSSTSTAPS